VVSRNSFRQSHQRCIVVEGTSNLTMSENVGYQTHGHCIYIGYQSRFNKVTKNLVSDTKVVNNAISGEVDNFPCAFFTRFGPNDLTNNIAVGGIR
jgi:parallel beta-helix repeat protein